MDGSLEPLPLKRVRTFEGHDWVAIQQSSRQKGFSMVDRLLEEARSRKNRFEKDGEALLVCERAGRVIGVCGLNREQVEGYAEAGRVRRLYVLPEARGKGLGRALLTAVIKHAAGSFSRLTVNVGMLDAWSFYEHLGFVRVEHPRITHTYDLTR